MPKKEVLANITQLQWQAISFAIGIALLASLMSYLLAHSFASPLSKITKLFMRLDSGQANLAYRLPQSKNLHNGDSLLARACFQLRNLKQTQRQLKLTTNKSH